MTAPPEKVPVLELEKLEVTYHRVVTAVQGISLQVGERQIVALLGGNGAGKTTTLRAISGFLGIDDACVTEGRVRFQGVAIENRPPHEVAARGIVLVPERRKVFENLTVEENLEANMRRAGPATRRMREATFAYFPLLARLKHREAGFLSGGERQMLAIGAALMCEPRLLLVDELSLGLAPIVVEELVERLRSVRDELGIAILLVEQNAQMALRIADHGYVLENGRIVLDGNRERLAGHADVQEFYLGSSGTGRRSYRDVRQYRRSRRWYG